MLLCGWFIFLSIHVLSLNALNILGCEIINKKNLHFLELRPKGDNLEKAKALNPLSIRTELGRPVYLYEGTDVEKLKDFGEVHPPAIADLFLAVMKKNTEAGEAK